MSKFLKLTTFTTTDVNESLTFNYNSETKEISIVGSLGGTETEKLNLGVMKDVSDPTASTPAIPTKVSQLDNDSNFITGYTDNEFINKLTGLIESNQDFKNYLINVLTSPIDNHKPLTFKGTSSFNSIKLSK